MRGKLNGNNDAEAFADALYTTFVGEAFLVCDGFGFCHGPEFSGKLVEERCEVVPWEDCGFFAVLAGCAAVDEPGSESLLGELGAPVGETGEKVGGDGFAGGANPRGD